jgi:hypothetical protein
VSNPLALVSDLELRLRLEADSLSGVDLQAAEAEIDATSALVHAAARDAGLATPWTIETVPDEVAVIVVRVAARAYRNPEGIAQENIGGAYSYTLAQGETSAYLTTDEAGAVTRAVEASQAPSKKGRSSGSVRTPSAYSIGYGEPLRNWWEPGALTYEVS